MAETFQPGDVVTLKTEPYIKMVVAKIETSEKVICYWFNPTTKEFNEKAIYIEALITSSLS